MNSEKKSNNDLQVFFIGVILLGAGLFLFSNQVSVGTAWHNWSFMTIGRFHLPNGLVSVPLIIGIVMMFYNPKSMMAKTIVILGAIFILLTAIMSVSFRFERTSLFAYIMIFGMIAVGSGIVIRILFQKNEKSE